MNRRAIALLLLLALLLGVARHTSAADAAMTVEVPPARWKAVRLTNLPKDATMAIAVQATSKIGVSLLKEADFKLYPRAQEPVFMGSAERTLSFTVSLPETGTYYLVLDNRASDTPQKVKFAIRAQRRGTAPPQPGTPAPAPAPAPQPAPQKDSQQGT